MADIKNYFTENQYTDLKEKLFFAIMYRSWKSAYKTIKENNWDWNTIKAWTYSTYSGITIEKCFAYNLDFLKSAKNRVIYEELCRLLGDEFQNLENTSDAYTYDDKRFDKDSHLSAIDIFWNGNQPVLDLKYYEKQTMAAKQVMRNGASMVLDEVGTGKTVAGIYTIQQVIQKWIEDVQKDTLSILIICPYNKREDWYSDILRQLGRESIVIDQSDDGSVLMQKSTQRGIPHIYISGNVGGNGDGSNHQLKKSFCNYHNRPWDLVIIDECHNCFDNYSAIRSQKILLLTATPIVVSGKDIREFSQYEDRMNFILGGTGYARKITAHINPIEKSEITEDDIFVCNFKEDIFSNIQIDRQIDFIECERDQRRQEWFQKIRTEKGFFAAIFADQDDQRLAAKMKKEFPNGNYRVEKNAKLEKLVHIIMGDDDSGEKYKGDSFLVFCETTDTVDLIYDKVSEYASVSLMVGRLYSNMAEIKNYASNKTTIIPILKNNIHSGNRSVLVTTGKSGGTGLNMGEFHTVVHYELPFSSNELEQRFGRIERADDLINEEPDGGQRKSIKNKMLFLINKSSEGLDGTGFLPDFVTNRMLYYAINKINITVRYMPIRNTVLFHPQYMKRVKEQAVILWNQIKDMLESREKWDQINAFFAYKQACDRIETIKEELDKEQENFKGKDIKGCVTFMLDNVSQDDIREDDISLLKNFKTMYIDNNEVKKMEGHREKIRTLIEYYLWLEQTLSLWGIHIDKANDSLKDYSEAAKEKTKAFEVKEAGEAEETQDMEQTYGEDSKSLEISICNAMVKLEKEENRNRLLSEYVDAILEALENIHPDNTYTGVFYYKDGKIENKKF